MAYTYTLDPAVPAGDDLVSDGAAVIREFKNAVLERFDTIIDNVATDPWAISTSRTITITQGGLGAAAKSIDATATWNAALGIFNGYYLNITNTASHASSALIRLCVSFVDMFTVSTAGVATAIAFNSATVTTTGLITAGNGLTVSAGTSALQAVTGTTLTLTSTMTGVKINLVGDNATETLSLRNGVGAGHIVFRDSGGTSRMMVSVNGSNDTVFTGTRLAIDSPTVAYTTNSVPFAISNDNAAGLNTILAIQRGGSTRAAIGTDASDQLVILNAARDTANMTMTNLGAFTFRSTVTVTAGGLTVSAGTSALQEITGTTLVLSAGLTSTTAIHSGNVAIGATATAVQIGNWFAAPNSLLSMQSSTAQAVFEMADISGTDEAGRRAGSMEFSSSAQDAGYKTLAVMEWQTVGATANRRGGLVNIALRRNNTAGDPATVWSLDNPSTATYTALSLYDFDNDTVERVTVGAADSGGAGFKVLRIPN